MKQVFLNSNQTVDVVDTPAPALGAGEVLVAVRASLISTGTETEGYGSGGFVARGVRDPATLRRVLDLARTKGPAGAYRAVRGKRAQLTARGYSGSGVVIAVGEHVRGFSVGDPVAYAGAPHAEVVSVGEQLVAPIPTGVSFEEAAFGAVACIALHGVRLAEPTLGERAVVVGLGIVGILAAQFGRSSGLQVLGLEPMRERRELATAVGIDAVLDPTVQANLPHVLSAELGGLGADVALLCASAKDSAITNSALASCRDRARVIMLGNMGLDLARGPLFSKELSFRVSRSYGPGRYDPQYEGKGYDYPIGFVRWTEGRNLTCFLDLVAAGRIAVRPMITDIVPLADAPEIYDSIKHEPARHLGVVLSYPGQTSNVTLASPAAPPATRVHAPSRRQTLNVGIVGCGSFATGNLLPHFKDAGLRLYGVANRTAAAFPALRELYAPTVATTSPEELFEDPEVDCLIIATRHDTHARYALAAIAAGKPVHVEKPLAITVEDAERIASAARAAGALVTVGFNRRFAPMVRALRDAITPSGAPRQFLYRINAPLLPPGHWTLDPAEGGGRLVGEGCHFVDLVRYLSGSEALHVSGEALGGANVAVRPNDNVSLTIRFTNGDVASVVYAAQGNAGLAKERLEVFSSGRSFVLDDFRSIQAYGTRIAVPDRAAGDKGFAGQLRNFANAVRGTEPLATTAEDGLAASRIIAAFRERTDAVLDSDAGP